MSETPLTDAEQDDARNVALEFTCRHPAPLPGENCYVVSADFARELERELNALKKDFELQAGWLKEWKRVAEYLHECNKTVDKPEFI